jgi:hypothetical protein
MLTRSYRKKMDDCFLSGSVNLISPAFVPDSYRWMCLVSKYSLEQCRIRGTDLDDQYFDRTGYSWLISILASRNSENHSEEEWAAIPADFSGSNNTSEEYTYEDFSNMFSPRSPELSKSPRSLAVLSDIEIPYSPSSIISISDSNEQSSRNIFEIPDSNNFFAMSETINSSDFANLSTSTRINQSSDEPDNAQYDASFEDTASVIFVSYIEPPHFISSDESF